MLCYISTEVSNYFANTFSHSCSLGTLPSGNAFWNWQNYFVAVFDSCLYYGIIINIMVFLRKLNHISSSASQPPIARLDFRRSFKKYEVLAKLQNTGPFLTIYQGVEIWLIYSTT